MKAPLVVPADPFDDLKLELVAGAPDAIGDQLSSVLNESTNVSSATVTYYVKVVGADGFAVQYAQGTVFEHAVNGRNEVSTAKAKKAEKAEKAKKRRRARLCARRGRSRASRHRCTRVKHGSQRRHKRR